MSEREGTDLQNIFAYDFFDTIVHRDCHPELILYTWAKNLSHYLNYCISSSDLYFLRKNIERTEKKQNEDISYEYLLKKIYTNLKCCSTYEDFEQYAKSQEIQIELKHIYVDKKCLAEIIENHGKGIKNIIISDFYADSNYISTILHHLGIKKYFSNIYVSSECGCRKSTSNLYKYVLKDLRITPEQLRMSGDNKRSDVDIPGQLNISSFWRSYNDENCIVDIKKLYSMVKKITFNKSKCLSGYSYEILFFISKLYYELKKKQVKKVYFCSREGQLMKKLFDYYQEKFLVNDQIETKYLYVSRKSTFLPSLKDFSDEAFIYIFRQFKELKLNDFLTCLGWNEAEIQKLCGRTNLKSEDIIQISDNNHPYSTLKHNKEFLESYDYKRTEQRRFFLKYLEQLGVSMEQDSITLVDVGWKGTIQDCIRSIIPDIISIKGYYLGIRSNEFQCSDLENKEGVLFTDYPFPCKNYKLLERGYMFYERIFAADHGPVIGYRMGENQFVEPIINNAEPELRLYNYIKEFQTNIVDTFKLLLKEYEMLPYEPYENYNTMIKCSLWKQCVYFPLVWEVEKTARSLSRENFGNVSKNEVVRHEKIGVEQLKRISYGYVDYTYRLIDKYNLGFLKPIAWVYCRAIYTIKRIRLER